MIRAAAIGALLLERGLEGEGALRHVRQHQLTEAGQLSVEHCHQRGVAGDTLHEVALDEVSGRGGGREGPDRPRGSTALL
jgi:hypothetical protein